MKRGHGFTLVELIVVMVIIGVLAGSITVYFGPAIESYMDVQRRANLTDRADGAVRAMTRDIRSAVANSINAINPAADTSCFELVPTSAGGRYRTAPDTAYDASLANAGNPTRWVNTLTPITSFDVVSSLAAIPAVGDFVVINNQVQANVYATNNSPSRTTITGVAALPAAIGTYRLTVDALQLQAGYDNARFVIVPAAQQAVFYVCSGADGVDANGDGKGKLYRFSRYGFSQNAACPVPNNTTPIVASKVASCTFTYDPNANNAGLNTGYMQMKLRLTENNQSVQLVVGTHTDNTP